MIVKNPCLLIQHCAQNKCQVHMQGQVGNKYCGQLAITTHGTTHRQEWYTVSMDCHHSTERNLCWEVYCEMVLTSLTIIVLQL